MSMITCVIEPSVHMHQKEYMDGEAEAGAEPGRGSRWWWWWQTLRKSTSNFRNSPVSQLSNVYRHLRINSGQWPMATQQQHQRLK